MKRLLALSLILVMLFALTACGGGGGAADPLKGSWTRQDADYGNVKLEFSGSGKVTFSYDAITYQDEGTYTVKDDGVTIKLNNWSEEKGYTFSVDGDKLVLKDTGAAASALGGEYTK